MGGSLKTEQETFGTRLAAARRAVPLTQDKLGEAIGVTKAQISRYESDKDRPNHNRLLGIAAAVKRSVAYLLTGDESVGEQVIDPATYDMILRMDKLPPALREFVVGAIRLAETTKGAIPAQFLVPPTKENWPEFHTYLIRLSELLAKDAQQDDTPSK